MKTKFIQQFGQILLQLGQINSVLVVILRILSNISNVRTTLTGALCLRSKIQNKYIHL